MKNLSKIFGIIALAAVIGFTLASCGDPEGGPTGGPTGPITIPVTGVTLVEPHGGFTLIPGATITLNAAVVPTNATNKNVSWASNNEQVATVADGIVTGVAKGTATITVTTEDGGFTDNCTVAVKEIASIEVTSQPDKKIYLTGDPLDLTGLVVTATFDDETSGPAHITAANITGFDSEEAGEQELTITYGGQTATFTVTVKEVSSIAITTEPTKTTYNINEEPLDITGLVVTALDDEDEEITAVKITADDISGFDTTVSGTKTITVTYRDKTATFEITVRGVNSITIGTNPTKTNYTVGQPLDITGLVVNAVFDDNTGGTAIIIPANISGFDSSEEGEVTVTVTYGGQTATFTVNVSASGEPLGSRENPIWLTENVWADGELPTPDDSYNLWYAFNVSGGTTYSIWGNGVDNNYGAGGNGTKTAYSIYASAFDSSGPGWGTVLFQEYLKWDTPQSFTAGSNSTVKLQIGGANGTYALVYSAANTRPTSADVPVAFRKLTAYSGYSESTTATTTKLRLAFDRKIADLTAADITLGGGVAAFISKGALEFNEWGDYDSETSTYYPIYDLPISGFIEGGELSVAVEKAGYPVTPASKDVTIYYISGSEPTPIPLTQDVWEDGEAVTVGTSWAYLWYSFNVTEGQTYYVWLNNSTQGNGTKTVDAYINASYQDGGSIFGDQQRAWDTPQSFTASSTGTVKLEIFSTSSGSFALVYRTINTRPEVVTIPIAFSSLTANGDANTATTQLTLTFDQPINGLAASNITLSGVNGATRGALNRVGSTPVYTMNIGGFTKSGTLTVAVAKSGYDITPASKTVAIYTPPVAFSNVTANGNATQTTSTLTLTFDRVITGLSANDITLTGGSTGAVKGNISQVGSTAVYTLGISGVTAAGSVSVAVANSNYEITGSPRTVSIYYYQAAYGMNLSESGTYTFPAATYGYGAQTARSINITNTGNAATGSLNVALSGTNAGSFTLSAASVSSIAVSGTSTGAFTVRPNTGLSAGPYTATVTVSNSNISANFNVSFTVSKAAGATVNAPSTTPASAVTTTSITVAAVTAPTNGQVVEYARSTNTTTPTTGWQEEREFTGLSAGQAYYFWARAKENANYNAGTAVRTTATISTLAIVSTAAIPGVTAPATGAAPVTAITETTQYTGSVTWAPTVAAGGTFAATTSYTATINLTAKSGYSFAGVAANYFTVANSTSRSNPVGSGATIAVTAAFPATGAVAAMINIAAIPGVTAPVTGATPVTTITETTQYTGSVTWNGNPATFAASTTYTATIALTAKSGFTFTGVAANYFTVAGSSSRSNAAGSGTTITVTAAFPATGAIPIAFSSIDRNGDRLTGATTQLTLTFDQAIPGLTADDIALSGNGAENVVKGALSVSGSTYTLGVSGQTRPGTVTATVTKAGYSISPASRTTANNIVVPLTLNSVTANGSTTQTTTDLTLNFDKAVYNFVVANVSVPSGITKGNLNTFNSSLGQLYLPISGFTSSQSISVSISSYDYYITGSTKSVQIYHKTDVAFSSLTANGQGSTDLATTQLTLTFDKAISGLSAADITLSGVTGVSKGTFSQVGSTAVYTMNISGFTQSGTLNVKVQKTDFIIDGDETNGSTKSVSIHIRGTESNPIELLNGQWVDSTINSSASGAAVWFSINSSTGTHYVWWNDTKEGNSTKTLDVKATGYTSTGTVAFGSVDSGWTTNRTITGAASGTLKIKVEPLTAGNTGTFGVVYSTSNTRPTP